MAKLPTKFEYAIPSDLNTYACKDRLAEIGCRYGEGASGSFGWHAPSELIWREAMKIAERAGPAPARPVSQKPAKSRAAKRWDNNFGRYADAHGEGAALTKYGHGYKGR